MSVVLGEPRWLLLGAIIVPLAIGAIAALRVLDPARRWTILLLRTLLVLALALLIADPLFERRHDAIAVVVAVDVSDSVRELALPPDDDAWAGGGGTLEALRAWIARARDGQRPQDWMGLVVFGGDAVVASAPAEGELVEDSLDHDMAPGTGIAAALRLAGSVMPPTAERRIVLVSDGNETRGNALETVRDITATTGLAAMPIDVVPLAFREVRDVAMVRLDAPPTGQPGQTIALRAMLDSTVTTTLRMSVRHEGEPVVLDEQTGAAWKRIQVRPGTSIEIIPVRLRGVPVNRFEAVIEPDVPDDDVIRSNNRAAAVTATPSAGRVLLVRRETAPPSPLAALLAGADIPFDEIVPESMPSDLLDLQNHDLVVLDDVPASRFSTEQIDAVARHVTEFGAGLLMLGGHFAFGAGGWIGTAVAGILPVELDPPAELRVPPAALAIVLDRSGSMRRPVAGARGSQMDVAIAAATRAIESLQSENLVTVISFSDRAQIEVPLRRNDDPPAIRSAIERIAADGGTSIGQGLRTAIRVLDQAETENRHLVLLTDGVSRPDDWDDLVASARLRSIRISTVSIGDETDESFLASLAERGEGRYHRVLNPRNLPRVLIDAVQIMNRPFVREGRFVPVRQATGTGLLGSITTLRPLTGLVVTAPRDDPRAIRELLHPDGEPLLARWQAGLGRAAAYTSDVGGPWSAAWTDWPEIAALWLALVRETARPPVSQGFELTVTPRDGDLDIMLSDESVGAGAGTVSVTGRVYGPDGRAHPFRATETLPGRFTARIRADAAGPWVVAATPVRGEETLRPIVGAAVVDDHREFARTAPDHALLREIAALSGGRVLARAADAALFAPRGAEPLRSLRPAWRTLLIAALVLLLLDIAARRIAWRGSEVAGAIRRVARRHPAAPVAATMSALEARRRRERGSAAGGRTADAVARADQPRTGSALTDTLDALGARPASPPVPHRADDGPASDPTARSATAPTDRSIDRGAIDRGDEGRAAPEPGAPGAGDTLEGLRRARERARRRREGLDDSAP